MNRFLLVPSVVLAEVNKATNKNQRMRSHRNEEERLAGGASTDEKLAEWLNEDE